jgi:predicted alpha/beta-hydrolase family hydrolase
MKRDVTIEVEGQGSVSALWLAPEKPRACLVLAHGAGAGMAHASMTAIAEGLKERGIASLRFQFPYMERGSKRVDSPKISHAPVRVAVSQARRHAGKLPLFAGGKSFGGRMTSQTQAEATLDGVRGLVFFGFPLHPAGAPSVERAAHLKDIEIPLLFLQGTNDALADVALLRPTVTKLGRRATLKLFADADHSFRVPKRSGRSNAEVMSEVLDFAATWMFKA